MEYTQVIKDFFYEKYDEIYKLISIVIIWYDDPKNQETLKHCFFGFFIVFMIALPNFVCRVSDEDYKKFTDQYQDRQVNQMMDKEKAKKAEFDEQARKLIKQLQEEELKKQNEKIT